MSGVTIESAMSPFFEEWMSHATCKCVLAHMNEESSCGVTYLSFMGAITH